MHHIKAPDAYPTDKPLIFLAGSIEMGAAEPWQDRVAEAFADLDITVLNPRRGEWMEGDEHADNPEFRRQVEWELSAQERADLILMHFDPNTKSPISLLELGLFHTRPLLVSCPDGFWRKGNIEMVCERYGIPLFGSLEELVSAAKERLSL